MVQLLVSAGADIDSQDNRKVSCLMAAFRKGHVKVVKWMVRHVTQFPSDTELQRFIASVTDKVREDFQGWLAKKIMVRGNWDGCMQPPILFAAQMSACTRGLIKCTRIFRPAYLPVLVEESSEFKSFLPLFCLRTILFHEKHR